jgi:hypothetical protein
LQDIPVAPLLCGAVPRRLWFELGGLDEHFGVGMFEDDDFSLRGRKAGYQVVAAGACFIHHFGYGPFAKLPSQESIRILEENRSRFETKWGHAWTGHRLRPGVRSLQEDRRFTPSEFLNGITNGEKRLLASVIRSVSPSSAEAGWLFNPQLEAGSALDVRCLHATPGTIVVFDEQPLATVFVAQNRVTALVPDRLLEQKGFRTSRLENDYGESSAIEFPVA